MKNFIQTGDLIEVTAPSGGITSGQGMVHGNLFGVAATDAAEGEAVNIATRGVYELAKRTTATFTAGTVVSYDMPNRRCDAPGSGFYPIGVATESAGNGATVVRVRLDGTSTAAA